jgi:polyphosphate kinase 2 (PPK2 family)
VHGLTPPDVLEERYQQIVDFEREVVASGTTLIKVMLHISPKEQKKRLRQRLERPDKHWKFDPGDITERARWEDYMTAYQIALERTHSDDAPWHVVPADRKWYARLAVHRLLLGELRALKQDWPKADFDVDRELRRLAAT